MTEEKRQDDGRRTAFQERFRSAENDRVIGQAGARLGEPKAPIPTPGDRLTSKQAEREIGRDPNAHETSDSYRAEVKEMEARKTAAESDALREQYSGAGGEETDSNLEAGKTQARVEGLVGNPD